MPYINTKYIIFCLILLQTLNIYKNTRNKLFVELNNKIKLYYFWYKNEILLATKN